MAGGERTGEGVSNLLLITQEELRGALAAVLQTCDPYLSYIKSNSLKSRENSQAVIAGEKYDVHRYGTVYSFYCESGGASVRQTVSLRLDESRKVRQVCVLREAFNKQEGRTGLVQTTINFSEDRISRLEQRVEPVPVNGLDKKPGAQIFTFDVSNQWFEAELSWKLDSQEDRVLTINPRGEQIFSVPHVSPGKRRIRPRGVEMTLFPRPDILLAQSIRSMASFEPIEFR